VRTSSDVEFEAGAGCVRDTAKRRLSSCVSLPYAVQRNISPFLSAELLEYLARWWGIMASLFRISLGFRQTNGYSL
jgi:hypothetical protein